MNEQTKEQIIAIALANGFKLKEQPDGSMALNPYVFDFANALSQQKSKVADSDVTAAPVVPAPGVQGGGYSPLPKQRRAFLCTKCGSRVCTAGQEDFVHPKCHVCDYLGFGTDLGYSEVEMRSYVDADRALRAQLPQQSVQPVGWVRALGGKPDGVLYADRPIIHNHHNDWSAFPVYAAAQPVQPTNRGEK